MKIEQKFKDINNNEQKLIADFLIKQSAEDESLLKAIEENEDKTIEKCWDYIVAEAKKLLDGKNGALADNVVFDIAVKYFKQQDGKQDKKQDKTNLKKSSKKQDSSIKEKEKTETKKAKSTNKETKTTSLKVEKVGNQLSFNLD